MLTLFTTLISFLSGGVPKLLDFFQDKQDKKHELALAQLQMEQQAKAQAAGFASQEHIEEIKTEQIQIQTQADERQALYAHDIAIGQGASTWVINARAMVRPTITYGLFFLLVAVDVAGVWYAWTTNVPFDKMMDLVWDDDTQTIWASVISFWFGTQAFNKK
jgi:D-alanyl-D-alanine carboxypeptidase